MEWLLGNLILLIPAGLAVSAVMNSPCDTGSMFIGLCGAGKILVEGVIAGYIVVYNAIIYFFYRIYKKNSNRKKYLTGLSVTTFIIFFLISLFWLRFRS